jgi:hypothetical protein
VPHLNIKESGSWSYREQDSALEPKLLSIVLIQQTSGARTETILYLPSITFLAVAVPGDTDGSETACHHSSVTIAAALQRRKGDTDKMGGYHGMILLLFVYPPTMGATEGNFR